jgi:hypothetical protein
MGRGRGKSNTHALVLLRQSRVSEYQNEKHRCNPYGFND